MLFRSPKVEEPKQVEEPHPNPLEELVKNLTEEVKSLKKMNEGLNNKVKELSKQPSAAPVNPQAKQTPSNGIDGSAYQNWREVMRQMIG